MRFAPELVLVFDPTQRTFDGQSLLGAYSVDDEGTPVAPVTLVKDGELINYDIGREPVKDFPMSDGHGRAVPAQASIAPSRRSRSHGTELSGTTGRSLPL